MAPSLHPASYVYAYDQCTNRSRWAHECGVHGLPAKNCNAILTKRPAEKSTDGLCKKNSEEGEARGTGCTPKITRSVILKT